MTGYQIAWGVYFAGAVITFVIIVASTLANGDWRGREWDTVIGEALLILVAALLWPLVLAGLVLGL